MPEPWCVELGNAARRSLRRLYPGDRDRVVASLHRLSVDDPLCDVRPLRGVSPPRFRLRVGELRVIFLREQETRTIHVLTVERRGSAYR